MLPAPDLAIDKIPECKIAAYYWLLISPWCWVCWPIAVDATTLEANAAMRSIVRRDRGDSHEEFLRGLGKPSGIATPTREDLARLDRKRKKCK